MENPFEQINTRLSTIESMLCRLDYQKIGEDRTVPLSVPAPEITFNIAGLAKYLRCSVQTINNLKKEGKIPFYRLGRKIYFKKLEIDEIAKVDKAKKGVKAA